MTRKTVHIIYGLFDPTDPTEEIRYVGYTHFSPKQRIIDHVAGAKKFVSKTHKQKWIRVLLRKNVLPAYYVLERTTRDWKERERYWIRSLRKHGCRLTNSTIGGEGLVDPSPEVRRRISEKVSKLLIGNQRRKGIRGTAEYGARQSKKLRASTKVKEAQAKWRGIARHIPTEAERKATSIRNTGRPRPDFTKMLQKQAKKNRGSFWVNNGTINCLMRPSDDIPKGFVKGRLMVGRPHTEEAKQKIAKAQKLGRVNPVLKYLGEDARLFPRCERIPGGYLTVENYARFQ
jgi:hypothetical protein